MLTDVRTGLLPNPSRSSSRDDGVGDRLFVAVVAVCYLALIALTPTPWGSANLWQRGALSILYLALGVWGFRFAKRVDRLTVSAAYLLIEFAIGMRINALVQDGLVPLILLPLAAQAVLLLPRI